MLPDCLNMASAITKPKLKTLKIEIMKRFIKKLQKAFAIFFVKRLYVITQMKAGVKYYYMGEDSKWTPVFEGAKHYKKKPNFDWISEPYHKTEEYYA